VRLRLHASALKRTLAWPVVAEGQRIHDLRHTAACLWPASQGAGVDGARVNRDDEPLPAPPRDLR
jgi:integrase